MKFLTKLRKADPAQKNKLWQQADLLRPDAEAIVREMILSLPGIYKIHDEVYGVNLGKTIEKVYGIFPALFVDKKMLLGLQSLYPRKVFATFTLGLDVVEIKK